MLFISVIRVSVDLVRVKKDVFSSCICSEQLKMTGYIKDLDTAMCTAPMDCGKRHLI